VLKKFVNLQMLREWQIPLIDMPISYLFEKVVTVFQAKGSQGITWSAYSYVQFDP
jgi:hypothetical protein